MTETAGSWPADLQPRIERGRTALGLCFAHLFESDGASRRFIDYLVQSYHIASFSVPLMNRMLESGNRLPPALRDYIRQHIPEERGHEVWILEDLVRLGLTRASVTASRPHRQTVNLLGSQLYTIDRESPVACLGYMMALESRTGTVEDFHASLARICRLTGIDEASLSGLRRHGELDFEHQREKFELLGGLDLPIPDREGIVRALDRTFLNLCELVMEIAERQTTPGRT